MPYDLDQFLAWVRDLNHAMAAAGRAVRADLVLDALARLGGVRCVVAGDGPQRTALEAQSRRLGLEGRVDFLGSTGDEALADLYRAAALCVVPSRYEPFGLVALEAMAAGCPCVVAATGGLREVAPEGTALRLEAPDASALARLIERGLADTGLRTRLGAAGREHARRFPWTDVARRTAAVHPALLERRATVRS
jgi:glycogen(starch) synthase